MTTAIASSAYPAPIEALLPEARKLAERLGEIPSRNALMKEFRIGAPKANAVREALADERAEIPAPRSLRAVPDLAPQDDPTEDAAGPAAPVEAPPVAEAPELAPLATGAGHPETNITTAPAADVVPAAPPVKVPARRKPRSWPVWVLALPAFVAIWSGWVGLGELTGFGVVHPLPGIADGFSINTAITLPIGVETYAAYALAVWLSGAYSKAVRAFARWSAIGSLIFGAAGQIAYHLMTAAGITNAPWWITTAVACLPVAVLGMGAALAHLIHADHE
ncbi:ABC transporter permease [Dactylosporangium roseum]|uniref:ABC transporter permease n=1 Tax=Dactylosporangium roseum TaxID=47989 RepID=A0ABY5Z3A4_9ACTN|nr:ABC transporter permease [Dactylosporangium roseum]UWZ36099.1 ABC transporter permease [Dactylosporangium roseum]UWZ36109.1 ABC transporter permease [Dactylosporangium roseum]UWZ36117.1 ABC transporter permease [Dactylosporangium roseum]